MINCHKKVKLITGALLAVLCVNVQAQPSKAPTVVEVAPVVEQNVAPNIWVPASVISREDSRIASEVAGVIQRVADVGDRFKKGDVLAEVNDRQLQLQLRRDEAELARLQSQLTFAQRQLQRTVSLSETNSTAQFRIDELEMERDVIAQDIVLAKVALDQTRYLLERSQIVAPFAGVVAERYQQPGEHISIGEELLRLVNVDRLEVSAQVPASASAFLSAGDTVTVKAGDALISTAIRSVVPVGDIQSRTVEVRIHWQGRWVIGDAVSAALSNGPQELAVTIPRDALVLRNDEVFVFRVNGDNTAEKIPVIPGIGSDASIAVSSTLLPGDVVITRGAERLDDGSTVKVIEDTVAERP